MTTKQYQCHQCGNNFTRVHFLDDEENNLSCPGCGSPDIEDSKGAVSLFKGISHFSALAKDSN